MMHSKIYVAGHQGLVGSAIMRLLHARGFTQIITRTFADLDLRNQAAVEQFFAQEQPEYVMVAAAKVGGILANSLYPADFMYDNLMIESNVIHASYKCGVKKLLFLGSSCIYPRACSQPIREEYLLAGPLEPTNEYYALAKIAGLKLCAAYNKQYGTHFISCMPTNLYGTHDNFDLTQSHVIPALIRKFCTAVHDKQDTVTVWGSGSALREFLFVDDLVHALLFLLEHYHATDGVSPWINIGTGRDCSIAELALLIKELTDFTGTIIFDAGKPDGTPRKVLDVSRMADLGWQAQTPLRDGLRATIDWYVKHAHN